MRVLAPHLALALTLLLAACEQNASPLDNLPAGPPTGHRHDFPNDPGLGSGVRVDVSPHAPAAPAIDIDSKDILARPANPGSVAVKHVLIGWKDLAPAYGGQIDPRALARTNAEAATLAQDVLKQLQADPAAIDALIDKYGEDPGAKTGEPYDVDEKSQMVPEFKNLAARLKVGEAGIVRTMFGYHVMEHVPPPPPDPLESNDVLARAPSKDPVWIQHVLIGWKTTAVAKMGKADPRAMTRTKAEADQLAKDTLEKVRGGADMTKLMTELSEDPRAKKSAAPYEIDSDGEGGPTAHFEQLAMRLKEGEAGLAKTAVGWHVMKRVAAPAPDPLDSADILKRPVAADHVKVKHILLGWKDVSAGHDPRAEGRDRAALEKLVKDTLARIQKGEKIEPLMKELSEDPGSAKSGEAYPVDPKSSVVPPFKALSLRLKVGETGVVRSDYGIHIIQRVE